MTPKTIITVCMTGFSIVLLAACSPPEFQGKLGVSDAPLVVEARISKSQTGHVLIVNYIEGSGWPAIDVPVTVTKGAGGVYLIEPESIEVIGKFTLSPLQQYQAGYICNDCGLALIKQDIPMHWTKL